MEHQDKNQVILLAERPAGIPTESTFELKEIGMPELKKGEVFVKLLYVSVDPGMRGFMNKGTDDAIGLKFEIGFPITSRSVAQVVESKSGEFAKGDIVSSRLPWQIYQTIDAKKVEKVDPTLGSISTAVGVLGVPGLAAYFGLEKIGEIKKGQTVVVSGAAGGVGSIAVQIAKIKGCRVIGIAGSEKKIEYLEKEIGIDVGINYKKTDDLAKAISEACPNGVDIFFDNVGGKTFDAVLGSINKHARLVICGEISDYNENHPPQGPRPHHILIQKSARMEGYVVFDFMDEFESAKKEISQWLKSGELKYRENLIEGFENIPAAFIGLFKGENIGKQMVKVSDVTSS
ncbi:NADP-dependent oxidoreductase [Kaistella flava (ex Peng et al. 2021)]|uniref:NADP-dependent oxidoreductase n=1 Tax=Kaistella flava (ex Peng et al. 2021) TaxID=2038776 RepID=A0A7M2Y7E7_9FLAO|nr:NADP-dependent oxidoreductase [Kaistella flava (ex Peng et al. 2021)]QOW09594.1 NADP-dependent oxidoreductase [Kaistella flava (ex Peng et al. 2021)]